MYKKNLTEKNNTNKGEFKIKLFPVSEKKLEKEEEIFDKIETIKLTLKDVPFFNEDDKNEEKINTINETILENPILEDHEKIESLYNAVKVFKKEKSEYTKKIAIINLMYRIDKILEKTRED